MSWDDFEWVVRTVSFGAVVAVALWLVNYIFNVRRRHWERYLRRNRRCEPNVVIGYATHSEVELWMCGDKICRCGGTMQKGYLDDR